MTKEIISEYDLKEKLETIKNVMKKVDLNNNKIIFINLKSFYSYLKEYYNVDIEKIMEEIEPFIPLNLCINLDGNLFDILNTALYEEDLNINEMKHLKNMFYEKARMSFLNLIKKAKDINEWQQILLACEELRKIAE